MKKYIILSLTCLLVLCGCGKIPKLQNGEEAVITFAKDKEEHKISAEDLYNTLKDNYGLLAVVNLIDTYILENEFEDYKVNAKETAQSYIDSMLESYGDEETLLQEIQRYTNYSTIEAYQNSLYISFLRSHALEEYAKLQVTDKEIEKFYNDEAKGDVEVYQILITPDVTDSMTSAQKKETEDEAKKEAEDIIKQLKDADDKLETFKNLVKEHSDDETSKNKDGNLGYLSYFDLSSEYDELKDAIYKLKDGEYSKDVIKTELGYHVIYRNASKEKESLDKIKDQIIETLAKRKLTNDAEISVEYIKYYRKLYNMDIVDSELDRQYGIYMNNLLNSAINSSNSNE